MGAKLQMVHSVGSFCVDPRLTWRELVGLCHFKEIYSDIITEDSFPLEPAEEVVHLQASLVFPLREYRSQLAKELVVEQGLRIPNMRELLSFHYQCQDSHWRSSYLVVGLGAESVLRNLTLTAYLSQSGLHSLADTNPWGSQCCFLGVKPLE